MRHLIDLHRAQRGERAPIPVTLPDDPRVRTLAVRAHNLADYETLCPEMPDERATLPLKPLSPIRAPTTTTTPVATTAAVNLPL